MESEEDMDRCDRLAILWRLWQRNYGDETATHSEHLVRLTHANNNNNNNNNGSSVSGEPINEPSIKQKSLQLIMEQLFAEINFLKDEVRFLREEGTQKSELITTLTDNTLSSFTRNNNTEGGNFKHRIDSEINDSKNERSTFNDVKQTSEEVSPGPRKNKKNHSINKTDSAEDALNILQDDSFLKEEIQYLREETKEKSKLIETLTEALTRQNLKGEISLDVLRKQCNDLSRMRRLNAGSVAEDKEDVCQKNAVITVEEKKYDLAHAIIEECGLNYLMDYELGEI